LLTYDVKVITLDNILKNFSRRSLFINKKDLRNVSTYISIKE